MKQKPVRIVLGTRVASLKNSRVVDLRRSRPYSFPSKAYRRFETEALQEIMVQRIRPVPAPYSIDYNFVLRGKSDIDVDNAIAAVNDVLMKAGVISDDSEIVYGTFAKLRGYGTYVTDITIRPVPKYIIVDKPKTG